MTQRPTLNPNLKFRRPALSDLELYERAILEDERDAPGPLSFARLRAANMRRLPEFKNRRGEPAHSEPDGSDWKLSAWCNAVTGELGELANLIKKIERGDFTLAEARQDVADELADVATYLDILAFRCGVDLGEATVSKFNRVSERVGSSARL
jgi:NTP pyrophosphatase (non-canonical NTP hydrolase)